jgi:phosphopantetheinyl transferase
LSVIDQNPVVPRQTGTTTPFDTLDARDRMPCLAELEARHGAFIAEACLPAEAGDLASCSNGRGRVLAPEEEAAYRKLASDKRRLDWLAGRASAKRALRRYFRLTRHCDLDPRELSIATDAQGAPWCGVADAPSFSISHCAAGGMCAVGLDGRRIGADWEMVAPRSRELARLFACPGELLPGQEDASSLTRLWTVKEAALKLLGLGLAASPRDVETAGGRLRLQGRALARWIELGSPRLSMSTASAGQSMLTIVYAGGPHKGD